MKKFIIKTVLYSLPLLFILVCVNYFGDAARIFDNKYEAEMADIVSAGKNVTNVSSNFDERVFRKHMIKNMRTKPEIVVLGSSRTLMIGQIHFDKPVINSSVSGASIEDLVAMYEILKKKKIKPANIILGLDPWTFNERNGQERWKSVAADYYDFLKSHSRNIVSDEDMDNREKYLEIISPSYFQGSLKNIPSLVKNNTKMKATTERTNKKNTWLSDGSLVYAQSYQKTSSSEIDKKVEKYITGKIYSIENFDTLSSRILDVFETMITDMRQDNINVQFFLAPYHPKVYQKVQKDYPGVLQTEVFLREFARKNNINVIGSFDPAMVSMDESYFYDGMHCKEAGIAKLLTRGN